MDLTEDQLDAWRINADGEPAVLDDAYVSVRPHLRAELRYVQRLSGEVICERIYWSEQIRQNRGCRSMLGYEGSYLTLTTYQLRCEKPARSFVKLKTVMSFIKVPQGC